MSKPEVKNKLQLALESRDAARAKLHALNAEYSATERRIDELHAQGSTKDRQSAAEALLDGIKPDATERQKNINDAHEHLRLLGEARRIQHRRVQEAEYAAAKAACEEKLPEHRRAAGEAILAVVAAVVACERAKAIEVALDDARLLTSAVIQPAIFGRLGRVDDPSAGWVWWVQSLTSYAGVTNGALRDAFAEFWPRAKVALRVDDAPALTAARKIMAAVLPA